MWEDSPKKDEGYFYEENIYLGVDDLERAEAERLKEISDIVEANSCQVHNP